MSDETTSSPLYHRYVPPATTPTSEHCRRLYVPDHEGFRAAINELLTRLMLREVWDATPYTLSADDAATLAGEMLIKFWRSDCMLGTIMPHVREDMPDWGLPCDGSTHLREDYPDLYDVLDPGLIVDADAFVTPDLRGRFVLSTGNPDLLFLDAAGEYDHTLSASEIPTHGHTIAPHDHAYTAPFAIDSAGGEIPLIANYSSGIPSVTAPNLGQVTSDYGGGQSHNNMPPYLTLKYLMIAK